MTNLYLAAPYSARDRLREIAAELSFDGHQVTSRWLWDEHEVVPTTEGASWATGHDYIIQHTRQDLEDIDKADQLVLFTGAWIARYWPELADTALHSGGRHVEMGYALATSKPVVTMGSPENVFQRGMTEKLSSFHQLRAFLRGELICVECDNTEAAEGLTDCIDCREAHRV